VLKSQPKEFKVNEKKKTVVQRQKEDQKAPFRCSINLKEGTATKVKPAAVSVESKKKKATQNKSSATK